LKTGYGAFTASTKRFSSFVPSCFVPFCCGAKFSSTLAAELEVAATQILESADEVFCAAEVPVLQRVLSTASTQLHPDQYAKAEPP
jgi:hypothetical protein